MPEETEDEGDSTGTSTGDSMQIVCLGSAKYVPNLSPFISSNNPLQFTGNDVITCR